MNILGRYMYLQERLFLYGHEITTDFILMGESP